MFGFRVATHVFWFSREKHTTEVRKKKLENSKRQEKSLQSNESQVPHMSVTPLYCYENYHGLNGKTI